MQSQFSFKKLVQVVDNSSPRKLDYLLSDLKLQVSLLPPGQKTTT